MNVEKLEKAIDKYKKDLTQEEYEKEEKQRQDKKEHFKKLTKDKIENIKHEELLSYLEKVWGYDKRNNNQVKKNNLPSIRKNLKDLLDEEKNIEQRWNDFKIKGVGTAVTSGILTFVNPEKYAIYNSTNQLGFEFLEIETPKNINNINRKTICRYM